MKLSTTKDNIEKKEADNDIGSARITALPSILKLIWLEQGAN